MTTYLNGGAGASVNVSSGSYHTDQYQLFLLIFSRALKDPRRTMDPSKATTFIIPYDLASDAAYYKQCARHVENICFDFRRCPQAPIISNLLKSSPWYLKNNGSDHLLIIGMNYAMNHYIGKPKCKQFLTEICFNCTKIAIDDYSYLQATDAGVKEKGDNWHATPFPADFHWNKKIEKPFPWENRDRPYLSSYIGSTQSFYMPAKKLRQSIAYYCALHNDICIHQTYGLNGTRQSFKVAGYNPLQISSHSIFCFQPIGDLMTRKGLFDSILQGCIPVTFDALTASSMYTWHWEEEFWLDVSIQFPIEPVKRKQFDIVLALQDLMKYNSTLIAKKQELIRSRVFELQYSLDGRHELNNKNANNNNNNDNNIDANTINKLENTENVKNIDNDIGNIYEENYDINGTNIRKNILSYQNISINNINNDIHENWPRYNDGTPMRDAYDLIMDHVLGWHSGTEKNVRNGTVPECWNGYVDNNKCVPFPPKEKDQLNNISKMSKEKDMSKMSKEKNNKEDRKFLM